MFLILYIISHVYLKRSVARTSNSLFGRYYCLCSLFKEKKWKYRLGREVTEIMEVVCGRCVDNIRETVHIHQFALLEDKLLLLALLFQGQEKGRPAPSGNIPPAKHFTWVQYVCIVYLSSERLINKPMVTQDILKSQDSDPSLGFFHCQRLGTCHIL